MLYFVHSSKASAANYSMLLKLLLENVVLNIIWHQLGKIFPVENSEEENSATDYRLFRFCQVATYSVQSIICII